MGRSEQASDEAEHQPRPALSAEEARTERSVGLIRIAVISVVAGVYLSSIGIQRSLGPLALGILALAAVYSAWAVLAKPYLSVDPRRYRAATLLADCAFITLWTHATGGPESEFWTLYLIAVTQVAMRFDLVETVGSALALSLLYVSLMSATGGLAGSSMLARPSLMVIAGFAVGLLARQRRVQQDIRQTLERVAEERSRALAEEQELVAELRQLDLAKSEFVAVASHEFRTPLAAILGVVSTLRTHGDAIEPALREELLDGAAVQANRLARLVDDLLTVSRIEDGALPLRIQAVHPERLALEAVQASGTAHLVHVDLGSVERVWCDADRIVRVLTNLLDNARKYSPPNGRIELTLTEDEQVQTFRITDHGPGIAPENREAVFERFRRLLDGSKQQGSGLGLYITKALVEAHGGTIVVHEASAGGAEFVFTLPRNPAGPARLEPEHAPVAV